MVPVESSRLLEYYRNLYFDRNRPLAVYFPNVETIDVYGPFWPEDYAISEVFTFDELGQALNTLNTQAGVGPDRVSSKAIKRIFDFGEGREYLLFLYNQCFLWGRIPSAWSTSELFVIYKGKGDKSEPKNYRPINLLNDFYRLYSRLIYFRLIAWAERYNYFTNTQFGF